MYVIIIYEEHYCEHYCQHSRQHSTRQHWKSFQWHLESQKILKNQLGRQQLWKSCFEKPKPASRIWTISIFMLSRHHNMRMQTFERIFVSFAFRGCVGYQISSLFQRSITLFLLHNKKYWELRIMYHEKVTRNASLEGKFPDKLEHRFDRQWSV